MTRIIIIIFVISIIGCNKNSENTVKFETSTKSKSFYKNFLTGKILEETVYKKISDSLSEKGALYQSIISKTVTNDSTIILYAEMRFPKGMINPFKEAQKFIGKELPFDTLNLLNGNQNNIKNNNDKPTFVNLWYTNCPPCIEEMPELNELHEKYSERVNFVSITFDNKEKVQKFLKKHEFNFTHAIDAREQIDMIGTQAYPINFFISKDNVVYYAFGNGIGGTYFENILKKLL